MTHKINLTTLLENPAVISKRMLIGGGIALILIVIFLLPVGNPNPVWGKYWMVRPLIVVPLAGAMGGLFFHFMNVMHNRGGWNKTLVYVISFIVYIIGLWMGTVLGLVGTLWN